MRAQQTQLELFLKSSALVRVAHSLRRDTLLPHEYDEQREALLRAATRSGRTERPARLLPTRDQIERVTGGWNEALSSVGLRTRAPAKPLPRAVVVAPATWSSHHGPYERVEVIAKVREFLLSLPSGAQATHRRWRSFSRGEDGIPSLNVLQRHGGLRTLTAEAVRPDWHDRAVRWETNRPRAIPRRPARRPAPHATAGGVERRITAMLLLRKTGPAGARELAKTMEISRVRVWQMLVELEELGYLTRTESNPRSSKQRYLLTEAGSEALSDAQKLRLILRRPLVSTTGGCAGTRRRSDETVEPA
jgi:DNA-binding HxlR family transcriptional regulator